MHFVPANSTVAIVALLGAVAVGVAGAAAVVWFLSRGQRRLALRTLVGGVALTALYLAALLQAAFNSEDVLLGVGEQKYFCEIDCHVAYSLAGVVTATALGDGARQVAADGRFYVVTLRTWFDERTAAADRGNDVLYPNPRIVVVVDEEGGIHHASVPGMKALGVEPGTVPFGVPLRPGEQYLTTLVFDIPIGASNPRLWVRDRYAESRLLIGHENSPMHGRVYFSLRSENVRSADSGPRTKRALTVH